MHRLTYGKLDSAMGQATMFEIRCGEEPRDRERGIIPDGGTQPGHEPGGVVTEEVGPDDD
jgi:hypothetical protein